MSHLLVGPKTCQVTHHALVMQDHYQEECQLELLMDNRCTAIQHVTVLELVAAIHHPDYSWLVMEGKCHHLRPIQGMVQDMTLSVSIWQ